VSESSWCRRETKEAPSTQPGSQSTNRRCTNGTSGQDKEGFDRTLFAGNRKQQVKPL